MNRLAPYAPYLLFAIRIVAAMLFFQHGAEKLFGPRSVAWENVLTQQRGIAGLLETIGPALLAAGFLTRFTAFILCGEMAVAYFQSWAPRGFWPITNGGEEAVVFCFFYLWIVTAGPGAWSIDDWIDRRRRASGGRPAWTHRLLAWEPHTRAVLRIIIGFMLVQHGARKAFGLLAVMVGGRRGVPPLALDALPAVTGYFDLLAGSVLILGLLVRPTALVVAIELFVAYIAVAAPRGPWPIRNGGGEALLEVIILVWFIGCGAGAWSIDAARARRRGAPEEAVMAE